MLKRNASGTWADVQAVKRNSGSWADVNEVKRLNGSEWVKVWPEGPSPTNPPENEYYLYTPEAVWEQGSRVWTCPETNWYRIICIGKGGEPGDYGRTDKADNHYRRVGGGGGGGGSGGIGIHLQYINKREVFSVIVDSSKSQFGENVYATAGRDGKDGGDAPNHQENNEHATYRGGSGGTGGGAYGCNSGIYPGYSGGSGGKGANAMKTGREWDEYTGNGRNGQGPNGTEGEYTCSGSGSENGRHGGMGGGGGMTFVESIKLYHENYNPGVFNYVSESQKKVAYGSGGGYNNPSFPGCVILEIYDP